MARRYAIASLAEAKAYLDHPLLGARLLECTSALTGHSGQTASAILGSVDAMKLRSSMTLFAQAAPEEPLFRQVLDQFFDGMPDDATEQRLSQVNTPPKLLELRSESGQVIGLGSEDQLTAALTEMSTVTGGSSGARKMVDAFRRRHSGFDGRSRRGTPRSRGGRVRLRARRFAERPHEGTARANCGAQLSMLSVANPPLCPPADSDLPTGAARATLPPLGTSRRLTLHR